MNEKCRRLRQEAPAADPGRENRTRPAVPQRGPEAGNIPKMRISHLVKLENTIDC